MQGVLSKGGRHVLEADLGEMSRAAMVVRQGRIVWVGPENQMPPDLTSTLHVEAVEEHDLRGATVLPAFVECHTHLVYSGHRADEFELRNQGATYQEIADRGGGILSTVKKTRAASLEELVRLAQIRADIFIRQGVTTIEVKSGYGLNTEAEFKMLKAAKGVNRARIVGTYLGPHAIAPEFPTAEAYLRHVIETDLPQLHKNGLACRVDIFVEQGYFPEHLARTYLEAARALKFDIVVHADQLTHSFGARLAVEYGARSADHLIRIDANDIAALAASETTCVALPAADLYLRCPYPPARALIDAGARVAIATDFNPGSSPTQNISLVGVLARLEMKMTLPETLAAYTVNAAHALGLGRELGHLTVGACADFVAYEGSWRDLFYSIGDLPIRGVWREGHPLDLSLGI